VVNLRWLVDEKGNRRLQYRQKYDVTIRAGMFSPLEELKTAKYEWSEWMDVPSVNEKDL
jgi:hypothetical protein